MDAVETHRAIWQARWVGAGETHRAVWHERWVGAGQTHRAVWHARWVGAGQTHRAAWHARWVGAGKTHRAVWQARCGTAVETERAVWSAHCVAAVETCRDRQAHCTATKATAAMIIHVVLFRLRPDLADDARDALAAALTRATREIPSIRHARVGSRVTLGRAYEQLMTTDYSFAAILEFEDRNGLQTYLDHPAHEQLAQRFYASVGAALTYDFEMWESDEGIERIRGRV